LNLRFEKETKNAAREHGLWTTKQPRYEGNAEPRSKVPCPKSKAQDPKTSAGSVGPSNCPRSKVIKQHKLRGFRGLQKLFRHFSHFFTRFSRARGVVFVGYAKTPCFFYFLTTDEHRWEMKTHRRTEAMLQAGADSIPGIKPCQGRSRRVGSKKESGADRRLESRLHRQAGMPALLAWAGRKRPWGVSLCFAWYRLVPR
jgi:hypothetical protein